MDFEGFGGVERLFSGRMACEEENKACEETVVWILLGKTNKVVVFVKVGGSG
jgi:hypothetical protein